MSRYREPTEQFAPATQAIAKRILASPLMQYLAWEGSREALQRAAEAGAKPNWGLFSVEFKRAGSNTNIYVQSDREGDFSDRSVRKDARGDEYGLYSFRTDVTWPSHGSSDPGTCLARIEFYREVALLAADIQAEFGGTGNAVWRLERTVEERTKMDADHAAKRTQALAETVIKANRSRMRKNAVAGVDAKTVEGIPAGTYTLEVDEPTGNINPDGTRENKKYELEVFANADFGGQVRRVA